MFVRSQSQAALIKSETCGDVRWCCEATWRLLFDAAGSSSQLRAAYTANHHGLYVKTAIVFSNVRSASSASSRQFGRRQYLTLQQVQRAGSDPMEFCVSFLGR